MATIFHFPDFMFNNLNIKKGFFYKLYYFFSGIFIGLIHKKTNKKLFCFFMNLFFRNENKIYFSNNLYHKNLGKDTITFPNKRIDRVIINYKKHLNHLLETYCLTDFSFKSEDLVIDCGANVGELFYALKLTNKNFKYIGFEPDPVAFRCLYENIKDSNSKIFQIALGNKNGTQNLYIDTDGADSSLIYFGKKNHFSVKVHTLDSYNFKKVKLIKLEAEGYEYEVLEGSERTLKITEFIAVDYGPEKGIQKNTTAAEVTNFLYSNNFKLIKTSKYRQIGLFKNNLY